MTEETRKESASKGLNPYTESQSNRYTNERIEEQVKNELPKSGSMIFRVYSYRFVNLLIYVLAGLQISILQNSFAPESGELKVVYNQSNLTYNLTSLLHMIVCVPFSFPANYIIDKYGTKIANTIGCLICLAAAWLRCLVNQHFFFAIISSALIGAANPFILNAISKISSNWFFPGSRAHVTGFLSFASNGNGVAGLLIPGLYFSSYKAEDDAWDAYDIGKSKTLHMLLIIAAIVSIISFLNVCFYRDKPQTPPSFAAEIERENFSKSLKQLLRKRSYVLICICSSLVFGVFIVFGVIIGQMINPFGFDSGQAGSLGVYCILAGSIGSVVFLRILKRTRAYKRLIMIGIIGSMVACQSMYFLLYAEKFILCVIPIAVLGFFTIPAIPIMLELANEICFPIGEGSIAGFIYMLVHMSSFLLGAIFSMIMDAFDENNKKQATKWVFIAFDIVFALSALALIFVKEDLRRTKAEQAKENEKKQMKSDETQESVDSTSTERHPTAFGINSNLVAGSDSSLS